MTEAKAVAKVIVDQLFGQGDLQECRRALAQLKKHFCEAHLPCDTDKPLCAPCEAVHQHQRAEAAERRVAELEAQIALMEKGLWKHYRHVEVLDDDMQTATQRVAELEAHFCEAHVPTEPLHPDKQPPACGPCEAVRWCERARELERLCGHALWALQELRMAVCSEKWNPYNERTILRALDVVVAELRAAGIVPQGPT